MPSGSLCTYTLPQTGNFKTVGIYKGVPGNSVPVKRGFTISNPATTLSDTGYDFSGANLGDTYFAAGYSSDIFNDVLVTDGYLQNGAGVSTPDLTTIQWTWGPTPPVSISSPEPGHTYSTGDAVLPLANIADLASYSSVLYTLNGAPVNPNAPLPISALPSGPATFVIAATNAQGTVYATSTFTITGGRSPLTITADNKHIELGSPIPSLTSAISGFIAPDTATSNDVTGTPACTTTANGGSAPGTYPITCTLGTLTSPTHYAFTYFIVGTLTIVDTTKPVVTINLPINGGSYKKNDTVTASASATDFAPITSMVYKFNGAMIDPTQPLPLTSAPAGTTTATLVVAATDFSGNIGYATSTFTVTPPDLNAPSITITSPLKNGIYAKTDTVYLTATITDQSAIATTTYWLNGVKINAANALPTATMPLVNKASVVATDIHGNTATSTVTFYVVKSTNSCLLDIITILTQISQDKTLPDKPTIQNLIADCSALLKGLHRYDDDRR